MESLKLGESLETIGDGAFEKCKSLRSLVVPANVKKIGRDAFKECKGLRSLTFNGMRMKEIEKMSKYWAIPWNTGLLSVVSIPDEEDEADAFAKFLRLKGEIDEQDGS